MYNTGRAVAYEDRLSQDSRMALDEGGQHFAARSAVHESLRRIAERLDELSIAYAVVGGMALFHHGLRRFTEHVDILVSRDDLKRIHEKLEGRGYVPPFPGSKNLRDAQTGVRIEFLVTGAFPGDGKPKPVAFPEPSAVSVEHEGIRYIGLPSLIALKLASGVTSPDRIKDIADVQELIKVLGLNREFAQSLAPYVRQRFLDLCDVVHGKPRRYMRLWRNKWLTAEARSIDQMEMMLRQAADELAAMKADGVTLEPASGTTDDYAYLVTTDPEVAKKYDMHDESEFLDEP